VMAPMPVMTTGVLRMFNRILDLRTIKN
jgi:hypothetical protein